MTMHFHSQNLTDGRLPMWRDGRAWWGRFRAEWSVFRTPRLSIGFEKGGHVDDGSGIQFHLSLLLFSLYLSFDTARLFGRKWVELKERNLEMSWHDGTIWLRLWTSDTDWERDRPWHRNVIALHVVRWIVGSDKCTVEKGEPFDVPIPMPEGCYRSVFTPTVRVWKNRFRKIEKRGFDIEIPGGIPFEGKGENSWDCGEDGLFGSGTNGTVEDGIGNVVASVLGYRKRYGGSYRHRKIPMVDKP